MRERTRVGLCRAAFFAVVIVPCGAILALAAWRGSTGAGSELQRSIGVALGCVAEWESLEYSSPHVVSIRALRLYEPRGGALLAEVDQLSLSDEGEGYSLKPNVVRVPRAAIPALWHRLRHLDRTAATLRCKIQACEVRIEEPDHAPRPPLHLHSFIVTEIDGERRYTLRCGGADGSSVEANLVSTANDRYQVAINTHGKAVSLTEFARFLPPLNTLGTNASFQGQAQGTIDAERWSLKLQGTLADIDLAKLFERTMQHLTGKGTLELEAAQLHNGKLVAAHGLLSADEGTIGFGLLSDLSGYFGLRCPPSLVAALANRDGQMDYSVIRAQLALDKGQFRLQSLAHPHQEIVIDADGDPALLPADAPRAIPASWLVSLLYPTADRQVAASQESLWLADSLPLPGESSLKPRVAARPAAGNPVRQARTNEP